MVALVYAIHYPVILLQDRFFLFGSSDISDYQHYFETFSSASSIIEILEFFSAHVPFYTILYPGWLYSAFDINSFIIIRMINFSLLMIAVIPLNHILKTTLDTHLQPWQILFLAFLPSTTRYTVMVSRDMAAALLFLLFISYFLLYLDEKNISLAFALISVMILIMLIRVHNVILIVGALGSLILLNMTRMNLRLRDIVVLTLICGVIGTAGYAIFMNFGPSYHAFTGVESLASIAEARTEGNTAYLEGYYPSTFVDLLWYLPLHAFYFLFSPMPWDVFSVKTAVASVEAWTVLILTVIATVAGRDVIRKNRWLLLVSMIVLIFAVGFGSGVKNAGGAMRWRLPATILLFILSTSVLNIAWQKKYKRKVFQ